MRTMLSMTLCAAVVAGATAAAAGDMKACSEPTQACLDHLAKELKGRGWVGIEMKPGEDGLVTVAAVVPGSPAEKGGLKEGDVLLGVNGLRYGKASDEELKKVHQGMTPGSTLTYTVRRAGAEREVPVVLGAMPDKVAYQIVGHHMLEHAARPASAHGELAVLTPEELSKLMASGKVHVFDANNAKTRSQFGVVPGAKLLASAVEYDLAALPKSKDERLVFYCANPRCTAAEAAAERAREAGYSHVAVMRAGIAGWKDSGQKTDPAPST